MTIKPPVEDFATDWDHTDAQWVQDPYPLRVGVVPVSGEVLYGGLDSHVDSSMEIACSGQLDWARRASSMVSSVSVPSPITTPLPRSSNSKMPGASEKQRPCP